MSTAQEDKAAPGPQVARGGPFVGLGHVIRILAAASAAVCDLVRVRDVEHADCLVVVHSVPLHHARLSGIDCARVPLSGTLDAKIYIAVPSEKALQSSAPITFRSAGLGYCFCASCGGGTRPSGSSLRRSVLMQHARPAEHL